jgi:hypothetical protein
VLVPVGRVAEGDTAEGAAAGHQIGLGDILGREAVNIAAASSVLAIGVLAMLTVLAIAVLAVGVLATLTVGVLTVGNLAVLAVGVLAVLGVAVLAVLAVLVVLALLAVLAVLAGPVVSAGPPRILVRLRRASVRRGFATAYRHVHAHSPAASVVARSGATPQAGAL